MLTKKTSDAVLEILIEDLKKAVGPLDIGGPYFPRVVVSVERDTCRRAWVVYFIDGDGRLRHEPMLDDCSGALDETLSEATRQSNVGGIDPDALLRSANKLDCVPWHVSLGDPFADENPRLRRASVSRAIAESGARGGRITVTALANPGDAKIVASIEGCEARFDHLADAAVYGRWPSRAALAAEARQSAAMQAMASVMGQVRMMLWTQIYEDEAFAQVGKYDDGLAAAIALPGAMDRAAARWTAQVRRKLAERDEASKVRVWCQGEED
jgi:hypothetical protein